MKTVFDDSFHKYGQVLNGYDFTELLEKLEKISEKPLDRVIYIPSSLELESLAVYNELKDRLYGGMDIDLGYCNGNNTLINCLEYHRGSELQLAVEDTVLPLGQWRDIGGDWIYDLSNIEFFFCPGGTAVELAPLTLHDSPFSSDLSLGFRMIIGLPRGTNAEKKPITATTGEDSILVSRNTWMLHYPDAPEVLAGTLPPGLKGSRVDVKDMLPFKAD